MRPICVGCKCETRSEKIGRVVILEKRQRSWRIQNGDEYVCPVCGVSIIVTHPQTRPRWTQDDMEVKDALDISPKENHGKHT